MQPFRSTTTTTSGSASSSAGAATREVGTGSSPHRSDRGAGVNDPIRSVRSTALTVDMSLRRQIDPDVCCRCKTAPVSTPPGRPVDLNADLGEGFGIWRLTDDDALLDLVTSANVACGFHAGDPATMRRVCARAAARGVAVGAQVSYRDLAGFGRRFVDVEPAELTDDLLYQLAALDGIARVAGTRVSYVKPHGALYNAAVTHEGQAQAVVDAVLAFDRRLPVLGLPGSALLRGAEAAGMRPVAEGFADRGYTAAGTLVPRGAPGALVHDPAVVAERAVRMAADGIVDTVEGSALLMPVEAICGHGDTPGAVELARAVRAALEAAGLTVTGFGA